MALIDKYNRSVNYLRIGVTDRCNLRCRYCMPAEGIDFMDRADILTYEEIIRLAHIFRALGVDKIRLTGGEPFVRKDIEMLLTQLTEIFPAVHITTNATRLNPDLLAKIGIKGLNISLDTLDRDRFFMITRRDNSEKVMMNIFNCIKAELPIKINMVVMRGVNSMEILDFIKFGMEHRVEVRFIEAMPFNEGDGNRDVFMPASEILEVVSSQFDVHKLNQDQASSSIIYRAFGKSSSEQKGSEVRFGIIPAYTRSLCGTCNRIRLTPKGEILNCLYSQSGTDLKVLLRDNSVTDEQLSEAIIKSIKHKLKDGFEAEKEMSGDVFRSMTTIGG